jgi:1,2-diacylglycerol 3-alpha-glucosyltransferase
MRILYVSNSFRPFSGGVVQSIEASISILRHHGIDARLVTFDFKSAEQDPEWVIRLPTLFPFFYKGNRLIIPWRVEEHLKAIIKQFNPHIIHVHHPFLLGYYAQRQAQKKNIPLIFTHHTRYEEYHHYVPGPESVKRKVIERMVGAFCENIDYIIAPGNDIAAQLSSKVATRIITLPSAIQSFHVRDQMPPKMKKKTLRLLTVSRLVPEKNLFFLLDACAQVSIPYEYCIAGYGPLLSQLKEYAYEKLKLTSAHILFVERPSQRELLRLYDEADVFIFSSQTETQGLVIGEAMAAGNAIIALDAAWLPESVRNNHVGYVINTTKEMAEAITQLHFNDTLRSTFQQNAFDAAQAYHPDEFFKKLHFFYRKVLQNSGRQL